MLPTLALRRDEAHRSQTESVSRRYAIVSESDLTDGVAKLATLHASRGAAPKVILSFKTTAATASSAS